MPIFIVYIICFLFQIQFLICRDTPRVSIITSVYKADAFIEHFLEDITKQTIFDQCELLLINANSPGNEEVVITKYLDRYPNIRYIKLDKDPGLYGVWNMGIHLSLAKYITNANVDDRLAYNCYEKHAEELDTDLSVDLVYSDRYESIIPNEDFYQARNNQNPQHIFGPFSLASMVICPPNNHPMWRKSLHEYYGYFDESYKSAGDWEFWLRIVEKGVKFKNLSQVLAVFYLNLSSGLSHSKQHFAEINRVEARYGYLWRTNNQVAVTNPKKTVAKRRRRGLKKNT